MASTKNVWGRWAGSRRRLAPTPSAGSIGDEQALLSGSRLFDHAWYARQLGRDVSREDAIADYLGRGSGAGLTPHPLVAPAYLRRQFVQDIGDRDPLVAYLRRRAWRRRPHPLVDVVAYLEAHPEAEEHPEGPLGHYVEIGAAAGHRLDDFLPEDVDLRDWIGERYDEWAVRRRSVAAGDRDRREPVADAPDAADADAAWRTPPPDTTGDAAMRDTLVDWSGLAARTTDAATVSIIVPTHRDSEMTRTAVEAVVSAGGRRRIDVIVWDDGSDAVSAVALDALPLRTPGVRVFHDPVNRGFALANDQALAQVRGSTVVFLNNDTAAQPGWLDPLVDALDEPGVLGSQSLLSYPSGTVQSAGVAFPAGGGIPHPLLAGFPVEDARHVARLRFHALTGAALALRYADAVAARGFDAIFRNGMEDLDLCLRLAELRQGHFVVVPESRVVHHESRTPGRFSRYLQNRAVFRSRWADRLPADDAELWSACGYRVVDREVRQGREELGVLAVPEPVLVRTSRLEVTERPTSLRWAIKHAAPAGATGEHWGDTHFARAIARALRELGQEVVIDARPEFGRVTGRHDDVTLALHGLATPVPLVENVNLLWVISHPEMLTAERAGQFDRVFAASLTWAERVSRAWGREVEPLLQATDPALFHPDRDDPGVDHPVLFVGSSRAQYRPVVRAAVEAGLPVAVYGMGWQRFLPDGVLRGPYLDNAELGAAYRHASIVLNDHWDDMRAEGFISNRLFDAAASGARVISDDVPGIKEIFGDLVQIWHAEEDVVRLATLPDPDAVFGDLAARRAVAARIAEEHSFANRAARLLDAAHDVRRRRGLET